MNENEFIHTAHFNNPFLKEWVEEFGELPVHIQLERARKLRDMECYNDIKTKD